MYAEMTLNYHPSEPQSSHRMKLVLKPSRSFSTRVTSLSASFCKVPSLAANDDG